MNAASADRQPPLGLSPGQPTPRLHDCVVETLCARHYSRRTERAYLHWIRRFVLFHAPIHPRQLREGDVNRFLSHLAMKENVAASNGNQALSCCAIPSRTRAGTTERNCDEVSGQTPGTEAFANLFLERHEAEAVIDYALR